MLMKISLSLQLFVIHSVPAAIIRMTNAFLLWSDREPGHIIIRRFGLFAICSRDIDVMALYASSENDSHNAQPTSAQFVCMIVHI